MAIYHFSAQIINRKDGRSAVACAAYRAGQKLKDERNQKTFNYAKRRGVLYSEILLPEGADKRLADRETLWNEVEHIEKRKDAQLAREINLALPHELTPEERKELLLDFVQEQFVDKGMVADVALHEPIKEHGDHRHNHHAHIMLTLRQADKKGLYKTKTREWNNKDQIKAWRQAWAEHQNRSLERTERTERVDHRTLSEQREEALQLGDKNKAEELKRTPEIHVGVKAQKLERKGYFKDFRENAQNSRRADYKNQRKADVQMRVAKNKEMEKTLHRVDEGLGSNYIHHYDSQKYNAWGGWTRDYSKYMKSRAQYNGHIISRNRKQAVKQREAWQVRQYRFQQYRLFYMKKQTTHAKKRLGLVEMLIDDIGKALMQVTGIEEKRSSRFLDYDTRFLTPSLDHIFDMNRQKGRGRERFLQ